MNWQDEKKKKKKEKEKKMTSSFKLDFLPEMMVDSRLLVSDRM